MSTRSIVGVVLPNNNIEAIYVHNDGNELETILSKYNTYEEVSELLSYGSASFLSYPLENCRFYSKTRKDPVKIYRFENEDEFKNKFINDILIEFVYLFKDNKWIKLKGWEFN